MPSTTVLAAGLSLAILLPAASSTRAQEPLPAPETLDLESRIVKVFEPEEISQYQVVSAFFRRAKFLANHRSLNEKFLMEIGIEPESSAEIFFSEVLREADRILEMRTLDPKLSGEAFLEYQYTALATKAGKLGALYGELLAGLAEAGIPAAGIERYCNEQVRPNMSVASTEEDDTRFFESVAEFDRKLSEHYPGVQP